MLRILLNIVLRPSDRAAGREHGAPNTAGIGQFGNNADLPGQTCVPAATIQVSKKKAAPPVGRGLFGNR